MTTVYVVLLNANFAKIGIHPYYCRLTVVMLLYNKLF